MNDTQYYDDLTRKIYNQLLNHPRLEYALELKGELLRAFLWLYPVGFTQLADEEMRNLNWTLIEERYYEYRESERVRKNRERVCGPEEKIIPIEIEYE